MLIDKDIQWILVIKLTENSNKFTWLKPTWEAMYNNFVMFANINAKMQYAQMDDEYGALSMFG